MPAGSNAAQSFAGRARERIEGSKALTKLLKYIETTPAKSETILTPDQAKHAAGLLKKVLPELSERTIVAEMHVYNAPRELKDDEIMQRLAVLDQKARTNRAIPKKPVKRAPIRKVAPGGGKEPPPAPVLKKAPTKKKTSKKVTRAGVPKPKPKPKS